MQTGRQQTADRQTDRQTGRQADRPRGMIPILLYIVQSMSGAKQATTEETKEQQRRAAQPMADKEFTVYMWYTSIYDTCRVLLSN